MAVSEQIASSEQIAAASEAPTEHAASSTVRPIGGDAVRCANCGALLPGRYCSECGQRAAHAVHSLGHFIREAAEDLTHADSRLWRTLLALSLRPGQLTCEFLAGRRVRYLPPVRLYLVLSVAFFLIASLAPARTTVVVIEAGGKPLVTRAPASAKGAGVQSAKPRADQICAQVDIEEPLARYLDPVKVRAACRRALLDNGRTLREALLHNIPRALFVLLPLIALVVKGLYRRRFYVEHLLFLIHNHAFVFLLFGLCGLLALTPAAGAAPTVESVAALYTAWYLFRAMRRVYGETRLRTAGKFAALALSYAVCALVMLALTALYSLETLTAAG